jgi:hypothetical protein
MEFVEIFAVYNPAVRDFIRKNVAPGFERLRTTSIMYTQIHNTFLTRDLSKKYMGCVAFIVIIVVGTCVKLKPT